MRRKLKDIIIFIVFILGFLISGCAKCPSFQELADLEKPFGVESTQAKTDPQHFNIFIDASYSMEGYATANGDLFRIVSAIVTRIPNTENIKFYQFGTESNELQGDISQNLNLILDTEFYKQQDTDLNKPFEQIFGDREAINLIFTDGVQSTGPKSRAGYTMFAINLKKHLGEHGFFSLKGTQASFEGTYYVEKNGKSEKLQIGRAHV